MIITALYDIYDNPEKVEYYVALFQDIISADIPLIVFTDPSLIHLFDNHTVNRPKIIALPLNEFELYSIAMSYKGELPSSRNIDKDTQEFFALMNTKIEFVYKATQITPSEQTYIWIDFGILKIIKDCTAFINRLRIASDRVFDKITIPGCWNYGCHVDYNNVNWRFCGGVFIIPNRLVENFYQQSKNKLTEICTLPNRGLTWETNLWYLIELDGMRKHIDWYLADHNDTILRNFSR
jgi:hypothetical protein